MCIRDWFKPCFCGPCVVAGDDTFPALCVGEKGVTPITLYLKNTTGEERELLLTGCLMNHYAAQNKA